MRPVNIYSFLILPILILHLNSALTDQNYSSNHILRDKVGLNSISHFGILSTINENSNYVAGEAFIDGYVRTKHGKAIKGALVSLANNEGFNNLVSITTDTDGYYIFDALQTGQDYYIRVYKNDDAKVGISAADLIILQKHLLSIKVFTSHDQFIAADANRSWNVSAIDFIEMKKVLLGIYSFFPHNSSWSFGGMPVDLSLTSPHFQPVKIVEDLEQDQRVDFMGIKIGDLTSL